MFIVNGKYIDSGTLTVEFVAKNEQFYSEKGGAMIANIKLKENSTIEGVFTLNKLVITEA